jgi:hypothetical protein
MKPAILAILVAVMVAAGVAGGLTYAWVLDPVEYTETSPDSLYLEDKLTYLTLIGDLYACEGDQSQAEVRLAALDLAADGPTLANLLEQYLDRGGGAEEARNLAQLARDLGASGGVLLVFGSESQVATDASPSPAVTPEAMAQADASPLPVPTATSVPRFQLVEKTALCADPGGPGRIAIRVQDAGGEELAGIEIVVSWASGQDRFFTGLRPELGPGYADFEMRSATQYDVTLADWQGDVAEGLSAELTPGVCPTGTAALSWQLAFQVELPRSGP